MATPYLGEIRLFAFNFAPVGWALCNGQLVPIEQNTALFSLLGTYYGGDGKTTFALPNLQGRVPLHQGTGTGLPLYAIGQEGGSTEITLTSEQLPAHRHLVRAYDGTATVTSPAGALLAETGTPNFAAPSASALVSLAHRTVSETGEGRPVSVLQPFVVLNFCIALTGIFPPRT